MTKQILQNDWWQYLSQEFDKEYYLRLREFLKQEYQEHTIYPSMDNIFNALHQTPFDKVKAVIIGQDPYHGPNQAHGLSFSVNPGVKIPPSLRNIYKELASDVGFEIPPHGYLIEWTREGVLLLNNVLTVRAGQAHSHQGKGWEQFTDEVIRQLNKKTEPIVYLLWGAAAIKKKHLINQEKHFIVESVHPSPLSAHRGFFGSKPFSKTNELLVSAGLAPINWQLPMEVR
ncbi:uracil-DNA glycosylase [Gracilibacillus halotolerans]|uniref:Uracil-DNA glycosylase n=1 Tax=Gracilibacillus halotolerans TaxID=74386 RepID=A0A841RPA0_9BACI|nr:uracil-DNA glycosylase [Gracilibacillus halotolerans]MBB6514349.1 uracil-DNA glycosylase [Gracilibacillus halotolerans]